jgi:lauroyl/myristoyl acyltransferase
MRRESTLNRWKLSQGLRWALAGMLAWNAIGLTPGVTQEPYGYSEAEQMLSFNSVELKDQLMFGLRVAFPEQEAFVDQVIKKVEQEQISRAMVNVVYVWSKKRKPKIPFPYFEYVLRILAEQRGVVFE